MAKILDNNEIEFSSIDIESAWNNSPKLINKEIDQFRMCFICKFIMNKKDFNNGEFGWVVDFVNLKKITFETSNFIAIHSVCLDLRPNENCSKVLKKVNSIKWAFNEENN
ncbi:hypothetical protein [Spiroplasma taiwanense]|uniref:Uncharacterized protein n=1 Tax=Spiroplasma taiwanense CT-1 TaxID=1276220 RepID=S5LWB9_9MOLU|nr:hypothetical protein [Spiroplasma taiwanense]AGR40911.1 hypothetical protein STAIW_v1c02470 [Spiroplasma taiwanense CT-1]